MLWFPCGCDWFTNCDIADDDFSGTLSAWTQVAGSWSISSGRAVVSSTDAILRHDTPHPDGDAEHWITVNLNGSLGANDGDKLRVLTCYTSDTNHIAVEVEFSTSGTAYLRIIDVQGTEDTLQWRTVTAPSNASATLKVCYTWSHYDEDAEEDVYICTAILQYFATAYFLSAEHNENGTYVGLGTGDTLTGTASFDNFNYDKHATALLPGCPDCLGTCYCDPYTVTQIQAVLGGVANSSCGTCAGYNATYILDQLSSATLQCAQWEYEDTLSVCVTETATISAVVTYSGGDYILTVTFDFGPTNGTVEFTYNFGSTVPDCGSWSSLSMTLGSSSGSQCDFSSATCSVSAV